MNTRKNSLIRIAAISFILSIFWSASAYAQPNITSFSGSLTNKGTLTITGSGFGTKTTGVPLIWDDFESGISGNIIVGNSPVIGPLWQELGGYVSPRYTTVGQRPNSIISTFHHIENPQWASALQYLGTHSTVYFTFWWKMQKLSTSWSRNMKPWIVYGSSNNGLPLAYIGMGSPAVGDGRFTKQYTRCRS